MSNLRKGRVALSTLRVNGHIVLSWMKYKQVFMTKCMASIGTEKGYGDATMN